MNSQKALATLGSRAALNLYFWVFLFALKFDDVDDQTAYSKGVYYAFMVFYMAIMAGFTYFNTLILLPRLWIRKKRLAYVGVAAGLLAFTSVFYVFILKLSIYFLPELHPEELSIITYPVTAEMDLSTVLAQALAYGGLFLPWLLIFNIAALYHHKTAELKRMQAAMNNYRETELAFLRNQMNPHFLFNTLNNLYALSLKKSEQTADSILKLSSVLRYILYDTNTDLVPFSTERTSMQSYIDIELLRLEAKPEHQFIISADQSYMIPPLIWLPILENLFKHTRMVDELEVDFRFTIQNHQLRVYCKNNWVEPAVERGTKQGGIGLANLKKRLSLLYPDKHELMTRYEGNYFIAEVSIDLSES
ncbi:MAG: sensor histidine kinase [Bacteroidia bacterium]